MAKAPSKTDSLDFLAFSPFAFFTGSGFNWMQTAIDTQEFIELSTIAKREKPQWTTPNEVVGELDTFKLRKFSVNLSDTAIPTLVLPPYAGHYSTIADYAEGQSLVQTLMDAGVENVYSLDYNSATPLMKDYSIDNYLAALNVYIDDIANSQGDKVNLVGLCQGGWFAALYAARFPQNVQSLVIAGSPIDTHAGEGHLEITVRENEASFFERLVSMGNGLMNGEFMVMGFKNMNPEKHYVEKYQDLWSHVKGQENNEEAIERFKRFEIWYENTLMLPGRWYLQVIEQLFRDNKFVKGEFTALGRTISPKAITVPTYLLAGEKDDITLPEQVFDAEKYFGTPKSKLVKGMSDGGHIGLFMGRSTLKEHWTKIGAWIRANQPEGAAATAKPKAKAEPKTSPKAPKPAAKPKPNK